MKLIANTEVYPYTLGKFNPFHTLLCSHSPNDAPPEPQQNVSTATVRDAMRASKIDPFHTHFSMPYIGRIHFQFKGC